MISKLRRNDVLKSRRQIFYSESSFKSFIKSDIANGKIVKINPAIITILDRIGNIKDTALIQKQVLDEIDLLLKQRKIHTLHVDINFDDYDNFGSNSPVLNFHFFTPDFIERLNHLVMFYGAYLNVHLLTNYPKRHIEEIKHIRIGAICFQLEVVKSSEELKTIVEVITKLGACASPVIEIVGTDKFKPKSKEEVLEIISPSLNNIGMLTFQVAATGIRSNNTSGTMFSQETIEYIRFLTANFNGTIQIQGGITTKTIGSAIKIGSEFLVCGTEIFNNKSGYSSQQVVESLLLQAEKELM